VSSDAGAVEGVMLDPEILLIDELRSAGAARGAAAAR
jgi:hypothetical protein